MLCCRREHHVIRRLIRNHSVPPSVVPSCQRHLTTDQWCRLFTIRSHYNHWHCAQWNFRSAQNFLFDIYEMLTITVSRIGYYTPFMLIGSAVAAIAAGLMSTFTPSSSKAAWVCYQLLNGVARGMMSQQPITAIQANLPKDQISIGTALVVFSQNFGAAVFVSLGQTTFENTLRAELRRNAPEINTELVASLGATNFRHVVPQTSVPHVVLAFNKALTTTFVGFAFLIRNVMLNMSSTSPWSHPVVLSSLLGALAGKA